jgi:hypothetical protein
LNFYGIYSTGPNQAWAVGSTSSGGALYRWDGISWSPTPASNIPLLGITGLGKDKAFTVGNGGAILRYVP